VVDRTFAADGDPPYADVRRVVDDADAQAGVARRLQARLDRQLWLLERLQGDPLQTDPAELPELIDLARRMRRDSESLLLLAGRDPGVRQDAPQDLENVLLAAATAAEEPRRVEVGATPAASVVPGAATELLHVLAELLDHATAVYPGARVHVAPRIEVSGSLTVDVLAVGATRHDPDGFGGRRALDTAERLAARSRHGISVTRALGEGDLVASLLCPRAALVIEEVSAVRNGSSLSNGFDKNGSDSNRYDNNGYDNNGYDNNGVDDGLDFGGLSSLDGFSAHPLSGPAELNTVPTPESGFGPIGLPDLEPAFAAVPERSHNGTVNGVAYSTKPERKIDELFGPLSDLPIDPNAEEESTPIYEAIASAWFADGDPSGGVSVLDWETPADREWRAAAERATRSEPTELTPKGLPRRKPGDQLVPPPRRSEAATPKPDTVAPERVRDRLGGYQRGVQRGRHRAPGVGDQPGDPEFW